MRRDFIDVGDGRSRQIWTMESQGDIENMAKSVLRKPPPGHLNIIYWSTDRHLIIECVKIGDPQLTPEAAEAVEAAAAALAGAPSVAPAAVGGVGRKPPRPQGDPLELKTDAELQKLCGMNQIAYKAGKTLRVELIAKLRAKLGPIEPAAAADAGEGESGEDVVEEDPAEVGGRS